MKRKVFMWKKLIDWIKKLWCNILCLCWKSPKYEPEKWNDNNGIQFSNNCYNYACNIQTGTYAQPGQATRNMYSSIDCNGVTDDAVSDGLTKQDCDRTCPNCCHKVALVVAPGYDYHWYRQDDNGMWSHKPGGTPATNLDNSGNPINDPRTADHGPYTFFCGCFCVCKCKVKIT
ncbi:hypothetical protein FJZ31_36470 [Candidatus Poribacteria bacterium]|nr:hypothetical protein [Candidatus Poribacteria bacterium]